MAKPPRSILKGIFTNFVNSLRPRQIRGTLMGEDYYGNKYFEIPANPSIGKRKAERWFEPSGDKDAFDRELTAEWEAWLRGRRIEPPTVEELKHNLAIIQTKKINAAKLDERFPRQTDIERNVTGIGDFPSYSEYEQVPGKDPKKDGTK